MLDDTSVVCGLKARILLYFEAKLGLGQCSQPDPFASICPTWLLLASE